MGEFDRNWKELRKWRNWLRNGFSVMHLSLLLQWYMFRKSYSWNNNVNYIVVNVLYFHLGFRRSTFLGIPRFSHPFFVRGGYCFLSRISHQSASSGSTASDRPSGVCWFDYQWNHPLFNEVVWLDQGNKVNKLHQLTWMLLHLCMPLLLSLRNHPTTPKQFNNWVLICSNSYK